MSAQDGLYMWFYGASPEQQAAYIAQGQLPPDYPMTMPSGQTTGGGQLMTFGDGGSAPETSEYGRYIAQGSTPTSGNYIYTPVGRNAPGGRYNPAQSPLAASDPESYEYQRAHGPTSRNPAAYDPTTELGRRMAASGYATGDPVMSSLARNNTLIRDNQTQTNNLLAQLAQTQRDAQIQSQAELARQNALIDAQDPVNAAYVDYLRTQGVDLSNARNRANNRSDVALDEYTSGLADLNLQNDAAIGRLTGVYDDLRNPLVANLTSQAAIADPEALAGQRQALGQLQGAASGSLDYTSQAAGAYADPKYLAMRDQGLADLYDVSKGSKDVHVGQEDPEAFRAAHDALRQMGELTTPQLTDAERFLYEQARQNQEMDERALSAARMSDLRRRGMAGGGAELTQNALDSQRISQNRLLSDLAASAGAVSRATGMLQSYGSLGSALNSEANALATGNANRQLQALGMYEQGAEVAEQQSFQQAYDRGLAADKASSDNQQTRLGGMIASGNQANAMQDDAFNRGQAADVMARYNKTFEQDERNALWGRTTDLTGMTLNKNAQNSNNIGNAFNARKSVADSNYIRDRDVVNTNVGIASTENGLAIDQLGRRLGVSDKTINQNNTNFGQNAAITSGMVNSGQFTLPLLLQNNAQVAGIAAGSAEAKNAAEAEVARQKDANSTGILGLPIIGSKNGLAGAFNGSWWNGGLTSAQAAEARRNGVQV